ncbi:ABC transporter permease [Aeromicrobium phragmitis]|uniref:ABC transporter permease n=1 Tax=Aeromicrobium phragmitis TaxID=2478914 RepID=A0A3L8PQE3_9ACTN|nr:ABC transporter permease [Aeromicrobium phragmitis]RLV57414.1 ABC transporter permease [Aeromicrobium phragmitis]
MTRILTRAALVLLAVLIAAYVLLPILVIFPMSVSENGFMAFPPEGFTWDWYRSLSTDPTWFASAGQSLTVALASAALSVVLGTLAALALVRGRFPFRRLALLAMLSPLIVPYVIVGLAVYIAFLKVGLTETPLGFVLVHTCLGVPYVMINVSAGLVSVDRRLEMASMNLGAGPVSTFMRVTLPAILPNVLAGALFAFITSWDEVVVAIFLSGPGMTTLPVKMWSGIRVEIDPTLAAVSSLLLLVLIGTFLLTGLARGIQRLLARRSSVNLDHSGV